MLLALSASRTKVQWGEKHFCKKHDKVVNKHHIDECDLLYGTYKPTAFNEELNNIPLNLLSVNKYDELEKHLDSLHRRITSLETSGIYISLKGFIKTK